MNTLRNSVRLIGNLGADPEIKEIGKNKTKVAKISLATSESYRDSEGSRVTETQWHNLVAWGKQADIAEKYLRKGAEIAVEGKLATRVYEDKSGIKRYITEVMVNEILMLKKAPQPAQVPPATGSDDSQPNFQG